jgi:hypothetical protein
MVMKTQTIRPYMLCSVWKREELDRCASSDTFRHTTESTCYASGTWYCDPISTYTPMDTRASPTEQ